MATAGNNLPVSIRQDIERQRPDPYQVFAVLRRETLAGLEEGSQRVYDNAYVQWIEWCDGNGINPLLITRQTLHDFLVEQEITISTRTRYLAALRSLLRTATAIFASEPQWEAVYRSLGKIKVPKAGATESDRTRIVLKPMEILEALNVWDRTTTKGLRNRCILGLAFGTGARRFEIAKLEWRHVHLEERYIEIVAGKGRKDRTTPIYSDAAFRDLTLWYSRNHGRRYVFYGLRGKEARADNGIDPSTIYRVFRETGKAIGRENLHPHDARTTFITHMLDHVMPAHVATDVGHADLKTTMGYRVAGEIAERLQIVGKIGY